jgi:hypothetical protein
MSKADEIIRNLTTAERTALINTGTSRRGAPVWAPRSLAALRTLGVVGPGDGLTTLGSIVRDKIMDQEMADFEITWASNA